jgi:hypothetical protein
MSKGGSSETNLTGVWHGLYSYSDGLSVSFVATLIDSGLSLSGSTHEPRTFGNSRSQTLFADVSGSRQGAAVAFLKTYQDAGPQYGTVQYEGRLSGDATEIEGRWAIGAMRAGKFLMIRSAGKAVEVKRKKTVRA